MINDTIRPQFIENGYAVVNNFLSERLKTNLDIAVHQALATLSTEHRVAFKATGSLLNLNNYPIFADLIAYPKVADVMRQLQFENYRWLSGYLISKPPSSPALYWHQDWWGWSHPSSYGPRPFGLGFMYYLSNTRRSNGALRVIPGSHRHWHSLHDLPAAHDADLAMAKNLEHPAFQSHIDEQSIEVDVGSVVIMDSRLLHSAYANSSDRERSLITLWYLPEFEQIPSAFQKRFMMIHRQENLDVDIAQGKDLSPADWPSDACHKISTLLPDYQGSAVAEPWVREVSKEMMTTG